MGATRRAGRVVKAAPKPPSLPPAVEMEVSRRCRQLLHFLKRGKPVERLIVHLTHLNIHAIHASKDRHAQQVRERYPLEQVLAKGFDMEQTIDCRGFTVPWHIDVRTPAQIKADLEAVTQGRRPQAAEPIVQRALQEVAAVDRVAVQTGLESRLSPAAGRPGHGR